MIRLGVVGYGAASAKTRTPIEAGIQSVYACLAASESADKGRFAAVRQRRDGATDTPESGG